MKQNTFLFLLATLLLALVPLMSATELVQATDGRQIAMIFGNSGSILGDDDSEDEDEKEDEEESEDEEKEDEKDDHEEKQEQEREREEVHTEETIRNANGSTTYIKREADEEKTEVELKTYDANGRLIEERKLKQENDEQGESKELEFEQYLYNNGDLQELKVKNAAGKELEITLKEGGDFGVESKVEYDVAEQKLKIVSNDRGRELSITPEDDHFVLDDGVQDAEVRLPLTVDADTGEVFVETPIGLIRVGISPDRAWEIVEAVDDSLELQSDAITLEEGGNGLEYHVLTQKRERFIGIFPVIVESIQLVDAETGSLSGTEQSFASSLLDALSI